MASVTVAFAAACAFPAAVAAAAAEAAAAKKREDNKLGNRILNKLKKWGDVLTKDE